jgi:lipoprotein-releasing system ATP-binding protein
MGPPHDSILEARDVVRDLGEAGGAQTRVLHGISLSVRRRQLLALTGHSGSGKSTLLYLLGAIDRPDAGQILFDGVDLGTLDDDERAAFRGSTLGLVFQFHFLLPEFSIEENIALPMLRDGVDYDEAMARAHRALDWVGLKALASRRPAQLSGGQAQRAAVARATAHDPALILADEPTGSLDTKNAEAVFELLTALVRERGSTIVMVTHDPEMAAACDRRVAMRDGRVLSEELRA